MEYTNNACKYFLTELVQTFYMLEDIKPPHDKPDIKSVVGWATYVQDIINKDPSNLSYHYRALLNMVLALEETIIKYKLYWVIVFGNHNALYLNTAYKEEPFIIINALRSFFFFNPNSGLLVISSSNNNQRFNLKVSEFVNVNLVDGAASKYNAQQLQNLLIANGEAKYFKYLLSDAVKAIILKAYRLKFIIFVTLKIKCKRVNMG